MNQDWKVYVRGIADHGKEVKNTLLKIDGVKEEEDCNVDFDFNNPNYIFYISRNSGSIDSTLASSELGQIIIEYYKEIEPDILWNDGDILCNKGTNDYTVFKRYISNHTLLYFKAYFDTTSLNLNVYSTPNYRIDDWRLATDKEKKSFYEMLHEVYKVDWNPQNKTLSKYIWKPRPGETFYIINWDGTVKREIYVKSDEQISAIKFGNYFENYAEAEIMSGKVEDLLKKNK